MCEPEEIEAAKRNDKIDDDVVDPRVQVIVTPVKLDSLLYLLLTIIKIYLI